MFGKIGIGQILVIFAVFVVFFGYKRLPELSKNLGKSLREFKRSLSEDDTIDITPKNEKSSAEKNDDPGNGKKPE